MNCTTVEQYNSEKLIKQENKIKRKYQQSMLQLISYIFSKLSLKEIKVGHWCYPS